MFLHGTMQDRTFSFSRISLIIFLFNIVIPAPIQVIDYKIVKFLRSYGFIDKSFSGVLDLQVYRGGIKQLQQLYDLPVTGMVDDETSAFVTGSRCGIPDLEKGPHKGKRHKRFLAHGAKWPNVHLKYFIQSHTKDLPKAEVDAGVQTALQKWADVSALTFQKVKKEKEADITIKWATLGHGDISPFDGPGGSLAHAFYPDNGGNVHVDDDETWTIVHNPNKHNLIQVVTHELGHSLGLRHSSVKSAMMYAYINKRKPKLDLGQDDIQGIQEIYGRNTRLAAPPPPTTSRMKSSTTTTTTTATPTATTTTTEANTKSTRKATVNPFHALWPIRRNGWSIQNNTEINSRQNTLQAQATTTRPPPPPQAKTANPFIQTENPFLSQIAKNPPWHCDNLDEIDAAFKFNGSVYLFWRSVYFKTNGGLEKGYPRQISADWDGLPDNIDAVLYWPANYRNPAKFIFFKGRRVWIYNEARDLQRVITIYSYFSGKLPNDIDAAFVRPQKNGTSLTYFIKGRYYYTTPTHNMQSIQGPFATGDWGFPYGLDAAFTYDNIATYFFLGSGYYASDVNDQSIQANYRYYPRRTTQWWLSCL